MSYLEDEEKYSKKGIDSDLISCLEENSLPFTVDEIEKVLAVYEGVRDSFDWRWILQLTNNRFAFLIGGCDYTGWDCQSWATSTITESAEQALEIAHPQNIGEVELVDSSPVEAGLGHMINLLTGNYDSDFIKVYESLAKQLKEGKTQVWSEKDLGMPHVPPFILD